MFAFAKQVLSLQRKGRRRAVALALAATMLPACGASDVVPLALTGPPVHEALDHVRRCAVEAGYAPMQIGRGVHIPIPPDAYVDFRRNIDGQLEMAVRLPGAPSALGPDAPGFAEVRRRGDAIWACAAQRMGLDAGAHPVDGPPAALPRPATATIPAQ